MKIEKPDSLDAVEEIFSCAPCGIGFFVVDSQKPLYLNDAYYKLVGYTPQEYKDQIGTEYQKLFFAEDIDITNKIAIFKISADLGRNRRKSRSDTLNKHHTRRLALPAYRYPA